MVRKRQKNKKERGFQDIGVDQTVSSYIFGKIHMTQRDIDSAISKVTKHDIGITDGRVRQETKPLYKLSKIVNRALTDGLPNIVRQKCCQMFGTGFGNLMADGVLSTFDRLGYGDVNKQRSLGTPYYYASYRTPAYYQAQQPIATPSRLPAIDQIDFQDVTTMRERILAEDLLDRMRAAIAKYGHISVADLFDSLQFDDYDFTFNNYGWKNLNNVQIRRSNYGWWLDLPRPISVP